MKHATPAPATPRPPVEEIFAGAVQGDFDPHLGTIGLLTQAALGFVPVIGQICAGRDIVADRRQGDRLGTICNALALVPLLGGIPKAALLAWRWRQAHGSD
jgi:hypothetical protein